MNTKFSLIIFAGIAIATGGCIEKLIRGENIFLNTATLAIGLCYLAYKICRTNKA